MTSIVFANASVEFPIFNASKRSLRHQVLKMAAFGGLGERDSRIVRVRALSDISLTIGAGERVGILGHNGAGKTSFLKVLSGIHEPTKGEVIRKGRISALTDISIGIDPEATGRENIFIRGALLGFTRQEMASKLEDIIAFTQLREFIDLPVRTYSSGMHLRLAFAVATAIDPEILVLDEWLSVGDEEFRIEAEARMASLLARTKVLVIASHSRQLIQDTCSRVIWLDAGRVKMDGPADEVLNAYFK